MTPDAGFPMWFLVAVGLVVSALWGAILLLFKQMNECKESHGKCREESSRLTEQVRGQEIELDRLRKQNASQEARIQRLEQSDNRPTP